MLPGLVEGMVTFNTTDISDKSQFLAASNDGFTYLQINNNAGNVTLSCTAPADAPDSCTDTNSLGIFDIKLQKEPDFLCVHLNEENSELRACLWYTNSTFIRENKVNDGTYDFRMFDLTQGDVWEDWPEGGDWHDDEKDEDGHDGHDDLHKILHEKLSVEEYDNLMMTAQNYVDLYHKTGAFDNIYNAHIYQEYIVVIEELNYYMNLADVIQDYDLDEFVQKLGFHLEKFDGDKDDKDDKDDEDDKDDHHTLQPFTLERTFDVS